LHDPVGDGGSDGEFPSEKKAEQTGGDEWVKGGKSTDRSSMEVKTYYYF